MVTKARQLAEFIANADVDSDEIATGAVSASKLADTLDLSSKTIVMPDVAAFNITSGDVGIGTSSPSAKLDVAETDSVTYSSSAIQGDLIVSRKNSGNTANEVVGLEFDVTGWSGITTGVAGISAIQTGSNVSSAALSFQTRNSGTIGERMRITSDGKVGIGTTNPLQKLSINGRVSSDLNQDYYGAWFEGNTATNGDSFFAVGSWYSNSAYFEKRTGESYAHIYNYNGGHHLVLQAGSGDSGRASTTAGNVGIGTTTPSQRLEINPGTAADPIVQITNSYAAAYRPSLRLDNQHTSGRSYRMFSTAAGDGVYGGGKFVIHDDDGNVGRLIIDSSGNVGIGTTSPATPLDVTKAGGGNFVATFQNTTSATPYGVWVKEPSSAANGYPSFQVTDGAGTTTRFRVDSGTGKVGIGTGSPSELLDVNNGSIRAGSSSTYFADTAGGDRYIGVAATGGGDAMFIAHSSGYGLAYFGYNALVH